METTTPVNIIKSKYHIFNIPETQIRYVHRIISVSDEQTLRSTFIRILFLTNKHKSSYTEHKSYCLRQSQKCRLGKVAMANLVK